MEILLSILAQIKPSVDFKSEKRLILDGVLDSYDIIILVSEVNDTFNINISPSDMLPENFNSAENIWKLIQNLKK